MPEAVMPLMQFSSVRLISSISYDTLARTLRLTSVLKHSLTKRPPMSGMTRSPMSWSCSFGTSHRVLVAAPQLAEKVLSPEDLSQISIVSYRTGMTEMRSSFEWEGMRQEFRMPCRYAVNSMTAVREAVLAGRGAHLGPLWAFRDDLKERRVVELLAKARFEGFPIHAIWSPTPFQPAASRKFISLMVKKMSDEEIR